MNPQSVESSRRGLFYWGIACFLILQSGGVGPVWAVDIFGEELGVTIESSYVSKYLWKGYDVLDDHGAWQPSLTLDYRGFYVGVWGSWPTSSGFVDATELDYYLGYAQSFSRKSGMPSTRTLPGIITTIPIPTAMPVTMESAIRRRLSWRSPCPT
ncbi:MAG: hypothetical protein HPY51_20225 [Candidatus Omnitrophica bacterium]|nr:hypothetical protein [Candidatus Omnitrophota bacterium]